MWIPALLFVAALMLNFGTAVVWRVRGEIASRDVVWRARPSKEQGGEAPLRPIWPNDATLNVAGERPIMQLDDPAIAHPVVRGPLPNGFIVNNTLAPARGMLQGQAAVTRKFPLLAGKLPAYNTGQIRDSLLDQLWSCRETGPWYNIARRIPVLYQLPTTDPSLPQAFVNADMAVLSIPHEAGLRVLDHDDEVLKYRGGYADFHPRAGPGCELDPAAIQRNYVNPLVIHNDAAGRRRLGQVLRLPRTMTAFYLGMYQAEVQRLKNEIMQLQQQQAAATSPISGLAGQIAADQAAIDQLEPKIDQLQSFQQRIGPWEREMLTR